MGQVITIYYAFCPEKAEALGTYLGYQRELADRLLNHGFIYRFGIGFDREKVVKGKNGKPYWAGEGKIGFNVSNTAGLVVCGISGVSGPAGERGAVEPSGHGCGDGTAGSGLGSLEIGVDAEKPRNVRMPVLHRCCSPEEINYILGNVAPPTEKSQKAGGSIASGIQPGGAVPIDGNWKIGELGEDGKRRFSQIWTLKESYIKMTGEGLAFPLKEVNFRAEEKMDGRFRIWCNQPAYFAQRQIGDYWVSVCARGQAEIVWEELSSGAFAAAGDFRTPRC